jgi:exopolyphosphatase / guanosine-5'-triphosphate,3'-diphosphate pyrophosphatase
MRVAAIDVGTNTVRLLVADAEGAEVHAVDRGRAITRLGQAVDDERRFQQDAIDRTVEAIDGFVARAQMSGAEYIRIVGTSAVRDAVDRDAFAEIVHARTRTSLELLSGADEGRISYLGATFELEAGDYVVCDVGGGSTELSTSDRSTSLDIGSVRLKERCLHGDPPSASEITAARAVVSDALDLVPSGLYDRRLVGVAGTITTLTAVMLGLKTYDSDLAHRSTVTHSSVAEWSERLLAMEAEEIMGLGPVERGRADVIGGGALIVRSVMERWGFGEMLVSERDILEGLVLDLVEKS